jgi:hypothetical protein
LGLSSFPNPPKIPKRICLPRSTSISKQKPSGIYFNFFAESTGNKPFLTFEKYLRELQSS